MKRVQLIFILVIFAIAGMLKPALAQEPVSQEQQGPRTVEDGGTGLWPAIMLTESSLPTHTVFRPADLAPFGNRNKMPVIAWGNGACANSPWEHVNFLSEVASYGFLVIAIGPMPKEGEKGRGRSEKRQKGR